MRAYLNGTDMQSPALYRRHRDPGARVETNCGGRDNTIYEISTEWRAADNWDTMPKGVPAYSILESGLYRGVLGLDKV